MNLNEGRIVKPQNTPTNGMGPSIKYVHIFPQKIDSPVCHNHTSNATAIAISCLGHKECKTTRSEILHHRTVFAYLHRK